MSFANTLITITKLPLATYHYQDKSDNREVRTHEPMLHGAGPGPQTPPHTYHATPRGEVVPYVQPLELLQVVEVWDEEHHGQRPRQHQREQRTVCDDRSVCKVLEWDLEEDAHDPLEEALEL